MSSPLLLLWPYKWLFGFLLLTVLNQSYLPLSLRSDIHFPLSISLLSQPFYLLHLLSSYSVSHTQCFFTLSSHVTPLFHTQPHASKWSFFHCTPYASSRTTANTCIFINHALWFIQYLNLHMAMYCKIYSDPILCWLEIRFICIYIISTLTTLLGLEWLYKYLTKLLGITTVPSHKRLIKTRSSSCLNTFHSNKLAQPKALLADYLIIKSQMFSSVSKANHHIYHSTPISNLTTSSSGLS